MFPQYFKGLIHHTEAFCFLPTSKFCLGLRSRYKRHKIVFFLQLLLLSCSPTSMFSTLPVSGGSPPPDPPLPSTTTLVELRYDVTLIPPPSYPPAILNPSWRLPLRLITPPAILHRWSGLLPLPSF